MADLSVDIGFQYEKTDFSLDTRFVTHFKAQ